MSLYGALFAGVSGLKSQSNKIGVISDNIANVNTVGYKGVNAQFESLVVNSNSSAAFAPGGVLANNRLTVDKQGLLLATDAPTDIAVSGSGFFVVNARSDGKDVPLYTRAGSFRKDQLGNFVNAAGYFLQGWPLDLDGNPPATSASLSSLQTVNIESASGVASATTRVSFGANLKATETTFPGQGGTIKMDANSAANFGIPADRIISPSEYGIATTNGIARRDQFTVSTGSGLKYNYQYGGFTVGRDVGVGGVNAVTGGDNNFGDAAGSIYANRTLGTPGPGISSLATDGTTNVVTVTMPNHGMITGDKISLSSFAGPTFGGIPVGELNTTHSITRVDANTFTITTATNSGSAASTNGTQQINTRQFSGNIFDATNENNVFLGTTGTSAFTNSAMTFTITSPTSGTTTLRYVTSSPSAIGGEFNNLTSLAAAINEVAGLTARVQSGRLIVGGDNANESVTFANGDASGNGSLKGLNWVNELGLANVETGNRRFSTLQGLANLVNGDDGVSAAVTNPLSDAKLEIRVDDPLQEIRFDDFKQAVPTSLANNPMEVSAVNGTAYTMRITDTAHGYSTGQKVTLSGLSTFNGFTSAELNKSFRIARVIDANTYEVVVDGASATAVVGDTGGGNAGKRALGNNGSLLGELGLATSLNGAAYTTPKTTGSLAPKYNASGTNGDNMASGKIKPQFSRTFQIFDGLGQAHDLGMSLIKIKDNEWAAEVFSIPANAISGLLADGQVAVGTFTFNGNGTLRSVSGGLSNPISINWNNGSTPSSIQLDWGTAGQIAGTVGATNIGDTDGLSQFASDYNVAFVEQNGVEVGELIGVSINDEGVVSASFSNGDIQKLYKLPLADFSNPNGLNPVSGNVFTATQDSGEVNLRESGTNGTGSVVSGALESSNVELSEQLTDLIVAQRAYQSNTRAITAADELLEELNRL